MFLGFPLFRIIEASPELFLGFPLFRIIEASPESN
jgi:hypothetical protein